MKKLALALVCLVSVAFFASCTPEGQPVISVLTEDGYVQDGAVIEFNDTVYFGFLMTSSIETSKELSKLVVKIDDEEWESVDLTGSEYTYRSSVIFEPTRDSIYAATITATVTDVAGEEATVTINLSIKDAPAPLTPAAFEWKRLGGAAATGLEEFGLQWTSNNKDEVFAEIKPLEGALLIEFESADWTKVTTEVEKAALFSEHQLGIDMFNKVSAFATKDYDFVIGSVYKEKTYLIHITKGVVSRTDITITGEWK